MSKIEFMKADEDIEEYSEEALQFMVDKKNRIFKLQISLVYLKLHNAVAGAIAEENVGYHLHPNRSRCLDQYALSDKLPSTFTVAGVLGTALVSDYGDIGDVATSAFLDLLGNGKRSHNAWMQLYEPVKYLDRKPFTIGKRSKIRFYSIWARQISRCSRLFDCLMRVRNWFAYTFEFDHYKDHYDKLAEDLVMITMISQQNLWL